MLREIVLDTETTGLDPDQGHRIVEVAALELVEPPADRAHLPQLRQPAARHARRGVPGARAERRVPARLSRVRRGRGAAGGVPRGQPADHPQRRLRHALPQRRADPPRAGAAGVRARGRHAAAGAAALSRHVEQPRRAVPALRGRQCGAHAAWRPARLRAAGRGLSASDRRAADQSGSGPAGHAQASGRPSPGRCARRGPSPPRPRSWRRTPRSWPSSTIRSG